MRAFRDLPKDMQRERIALCVVIIVNVVGVVMIGQLMREIESFSPHHEIFLTQQIRALATE